MFFRTFIMFLDTLGALARNIKPDIFFPVAEECVQFGMVNEFEI